MFGDLGVVALGSGKSATFSLKFLKIMSQVVLGIDAAWTAKQPSGVALVVKEAGVWTLRAVAASYDQYLDICHSREPICNPRGSVPSASQLLEGSRKLAAKEVDLVAIDMPLAKSPIVARRFADDLVSRVYGKCKCGTHSPSENRPGKISDSLRSEFEQLGYKLQVSEFGDKGIVEVYPHPALVELSGDPFRLEYKYGKIRNYWRSHSVDLRRKQLMEVWLRIVDLLEKKVKGVANSMPPLLSSMKAKEFKAWEDMIDAIVCAWVATTVLDGKAKPFGNDQSAIWIPQHDTHNFIT